MSVVATFLLALTVGSCFVLQVDAGKTQKPNPPNILLLLTDDQDVILGGTSNQPLLLKHLADQGTTFKNYFVHTPVCCSSRSSILTGRYIHNGGAVTNFVSGNCDGPDWIANNEKRTFAVYAKQAGYRTSYAGKYLNTYGIVQQGGSVSVPPGWDKWLGAVTDKLAYGSHYYNYSTILSDDGKSTTTTFHADNYAKDYLPDLAANRTLDAIRNFTDPASGGKPFLIVNAWTAPHGPFHAAPWAADLFPNITAPRTPNYNASSVYQQQKHWLLRQLSPIDANLAAQIDLAHRRRQQTLQSVDRHIDQFVKLLEERGVLNNTVIIYTSDNGYQLGQHRIILEKFHLYESDIRVPFVIRGPGIPKNKTVSDLTGNIDIAPTLYELITGNSTLPDTIDGISILPIIPDDTKGKKLKRTDFLIYYRGFGIPPCGILDTVFPNGLAGPLLDGALPFCPPHTPDNFHAMDSSNNTYHCLRTLANGDNSIYCRFQDNENFSEYYDVKNDPWQLQNKAKQLSLQQRTTFEKRLNYLKSCKGVLCRK